MNIIKEELIIENALKEKVMSYEEAKEFMKEQGLELDKKTYNFILKKLGGLSNKEIKSANKPIKEELANTYDIVDIQFLLDGANGNISDEQIDKDIRMYKKIGRWLKVKDYSKVAVIRDNDQLDPKDIGKEPIDIGTSSYGGPLEMYGDFILERDGYNYFLYFKDEDSAKEYIEYYDKAMNESLDEDKVADKHNTEIDIKDVEKQLHNERVRLGQILQDKDLSIEERRKLEDDSTKVIKELEAEIKALKDKSNSLEEDNVDYEDSVRIENDFDSLDGDTEVPYIEVDSKSVQDSDGFYTDYTWYTNGKKHIFIFGDSELYDADNSDYDWEIDIYPGEEDKAQKEAKEWFDSYKGFEE